MLFMTLTNLNYNLWAYRWLLYIDGDECQLEKFNLKM